MHKKPSVFILIIIVEAITLFTLNGNAHSSPLDPLIVWEKMIPDSSKGRHLLKEKKCDELWNEVEIYYSKDGTKFYKPDKIRTSIDQSGFKEVPAGKAKIVVYREKKMAGFIMRFRLTVNEYAFADLYNGNCFSLIVPVDKKIDIGVSLVDEKGISKYYESVPLLSNENKIYYYKLKIGFKKATISRTELSAVQKYFQNDDKPVTIPIEIDWQTFFNSENQPFNTKSIDTAGNISVWHYKRYSVYKPYR